MKFKSKPVLFISLGVNFLCILFFVLALSQKASSISFYDSRDGIERSTAGTLVSVPLFGQVIFNPVEITLHKGETATMQFSVVLQNRQANYLITAIYDHEIIGTAPTGFGVLITARETGETIMQTLGDNGFRDIALIKVIE
jgi:hypothetical protein